MPLISVLLPVYNTEPQHLRQAIDSVLAQSLSDFELIIVNDYSSDSNVEQIIKSYDDPRIAYSVNERNLGIAATRNKMLDMAKGRYIAVMDHDDICLPERFAKQISVMENNPSIGICGTGQKRFGKLFKNNTIIYPERDQDIRAEMFFKCVIHHPSTMMRKETLDRHHIRYDETLVSLNDRILYRDISEHAALYNLPEVLCLYRLHAGMTSKKRRQVIQAEQMRVRDTYLQKIQVNLTSEQRDTLNHYVMSGRTRIKDKAALQQVESVLTELSAANKKSGYLPTQAFDRICAQYLIKRCMNAMCYGRINSASILKNSSLPVDAVQIPAVLTLFNLLGRK